MSEVNTTESSLSPSSSTALLGDCEAAKIEQITKWRTSDGEEFSSIGSAEYHVSQIMAARKANAVLDAGGSIAEALRAGGWKGYDGTILEHVTTASKLVISHWQCRDNPGYQPRRILSDRKVWVSGHAGSWSGPYGDAVSIQDLITYASHKDSVLA